jgi:hypothetical protein
MKTGIIILSIGLLAGCSQRPSGTVPAPQAQTDASMSREQAIAIASGAHNMDYDRTAQISVDLTNGQYIVTFPVKKPDLQPGTRWRGPDYAAKIWIDAKTGKVMKAMVGS